MAEGEQQSAQPAGESQSHSYDQQAPNQQIHSSRKRTFDQVESPTKQSNNQHHGNQRSNYHNQSNQRPQYQNRRPYTPHYGKARHLPEEQAVQLYHPLRSAPGTLPSAYPDFLSLVHNEIEQYVASVQMDKEEIQMKNDIIDKLNQLVKSLWGPNAIVKPFGSFVTGFSLPHSDLDLVVQLPNMTPGSAADELHNLRTALSSLPFTIPPHFNLLGHARIPILKYIDHDRAIKMDLCVNQVDGLDTVPLMQAYSVDFPSLKPLLLTVKLMLARLGLHEVFTGGVNSFIMQLMIIAFLQLHRAVESASSDQPGAAPDNLGMLLYSFLDYWAFKFDYENYGMTLALPRSMLAPGQPDQPRFYLKSEKNRFEYNKPYLLSIENPLHPERDSCASSFGMLRIRRSFAIAHELMTVLSGEWALSGGVNRTTGEIVPNIKIPVPVDVVAERESDAAAEGDDQSHDDIIEIDVNMNVDAEAETMPTLTPLERKKIADEKRIVLGPTLRTLTTRSLFVTPQLIAALNEKQAEWKEKKKKAQEYRRMIRSKKAISNAPAVAEEAVNVVDAGDTEEKPKKVKKPKVSKVEKLRRKLARERAEAEPTSEVTDIATKANEEPSVTAAAVDGDAVEEGAKETRAEKRARRKQRKLELEAAAAAAGESTETSEPVTTNKSTTSDGLPDVTEDKPKKHKKRKRDVSQD